ncbi:ImmA/IrrE family metallo-endopeptidase [Roseibium sp.]|uniref:ImmA/IrrE family metallo-endopeptidase n=1 Tax=Roseibium sp. TaxID=1936156 RepID=UPI003BAC23C0
MNLDKGPERWANDLSILLTQAYGPNRFPVDVSKLAGDYSKQVFPDEPITRVRARGFEGFEGALTPKPNGSGEWGIGYSSSLRSRGRVNFTIAHELGHYLLHRKKYPQGFQCRPEDMVRWDSEYNRVEAEANRFAAGLLMPLDDFRAQLPANQKTDLDMLCGCADRYEVSLTAAILRWLTYTQKRAILVVSREGFILWARSSEPAFKSGAFIKVAGLPPQEVPDASPVAKSNGAIGIVEPKELRKGTWLNEPVVEHSLISERYDLSISLLILQASAPSIGIAEEVTEDMVDILSRPFNHR